MTRVSHLMTPVLAAGALLGTLSFVFLRAEPIGVANDARALAGLRDMRDLDTRLDAEALRLANDLGVNRAGGARGATAAADRASLFEPLLRQLEREAPTARIAPGLPALRAALDEKHRAFAELESVHARSLRLLDEYERSARDLVPPADSGRARAGELALQIGRVGDGLRALDVRDHDTAAPRVDALIDAVPLAAASADPARRAKTAHAQAAARAFLAARGAEAAAWRHFSFATAGERIALNAGTLSRDIVATLDEKERWRLYLYAYGAALLLVLAYAAARMIASRRSLLVQREALEQRLADLGLGLDAARTRLEAADAQLIEAQKMSSLGRMVAGMAHEIDSPLSNVKATLEEARRNLPEVREACQRSERLVALLCAPAPDPAAIAAARGALADRLSELRDDHVLDRLDTMAWEGSSGIEQVLALATHLRSFSRADASRVAGFNVNDGVAATLLIARPMLRRVDVDKALADVPAITCSPAQVSQVLLTMVTNALEAIDKPRGRLSIATRAVGSGSVAIDIADNGRGMPPEALPRLFDPSFATRDSLRRGVGLVVAQKIVAQHGGRIEVRSQPGVGTTFTVTLPQEPPPSRAAA